MVSVTLFGNFDNTGGFTECDNLVLLSRARRERRVAIGNGRELEMNRSGGWTEK